MAFITLIYWKQLYMSRQECSCQKRLWWWRKRWRGKGYQKER